MSFYIYDISLFVIFTLFVILFLYKRRKNLEREGILFLYRTKLGIKIINYIGGKYKRILNILKYVVVFVGYGLMAGMLLMLGQIVYIFFKFPEVVKAAKIPPIVPLVPYLPEIFKIPFLPPFYFTYWIIIIAIVAVFHEFSHGIFSKLNNIKIKSTGFAFLGPFLGAFVEPDEKKVEKIKKLDQISILAAGSFANVVIAVIFFIIFWLFFVSAFTSSGVIFDNYSYDLISVNKIDQIGRNISVDLNGGLELTEVKVDDKIYFIRSDLIDKISEEKDLIVRAYHDSPALRVGLSGVIININGVVINEYNDLREEMLKYNPEDKIKITTLLGKEEKDFDIVLAENPNDKEKAFIGIGFLPQGTTVLGKIREKLAFFKNSYTYYSPRSNPDLILFIYNLLWWILLVNIAVALFNMLPVGIFDGGRVFYLTVLSITKSEKIAKKAFVIITYLILGIFALLMVLWAVAYLA